MASMSACAGWFCAGGGHEPAAKLADGLFPDFRILADMAQVQGVHGQAAGPVRRRCGI